MARFTSDPFSSESLTRTWAGSPGDGSARRTALRAGPEDAVVGVEARKGRQGSQVRLLPLGLSGIAGTRIEVADPVDGVLGEECLSQLPQVQPSERSVPEGAVVEIEAVYVEVGDQSLLPCKDRDRLGGRSRPHRLSDRGGE